MPATLVPSREATLPGPFSCSSAVVGRSVRITLAGEVDLFTAPVMLAALRRAEATAATVVLDLRRLDFIDCCGLGVMLAADRRIRAAGGRLLVVRPPSGIERLLVLAGFDHPLHFVDRPPAPPRATALGPLRPEATRRLDVPPVASFDLLPVIDVRPPGGPPQLPPAGGPPASATPDARPAPGAADRGRPAR